MSEKQLFTDINEKFIAYSLVNYVFYDKRPEITPAFWQDAEILIRYLKRDVWSITDRQRAYGETAISLYAVRYIIEHLSKAEIVKVVGQFLLSVGKTSLVELFKEKLHANVYDLVATQEKRMVTKRDITDKSGFDSSKYADIFRYPGWVDFDDKAFDLIAKEIYYGRDAFSDEDILYFLGASDTFRSYDKWFYLCKYILMTTHDFNVFYLAGDILNIIWITVDPEDEKTNKWFRDEVFEIFWSRVGDIKVLTGKKELKNLDDEEKKILDDSIGWLKSLPDLKERLPKLPKKFELCFADPDKVTFEKAMRALKRVMKKEDASIEKIGNAVACIADVSWESQDAAKFEKYVLSNVLPVLKDKKAIAFIKHAIHHAIETGKTVERERKTIIGIQKHLKKWPNNVSPFEHPEFLSEIRLEYIEKAIVEREDPYYEYASSLWDMELDLLVNGEKCKAKIYDPALQKKIYDLISKSHEFNCESEIPNQYGREVFARK